MKPRNPNKKSDPNVTPKASENNNVNKTTAPTVSSPTSPKQRPSPSRPSGRPVKQSDYTKVVNGIQLEGNLAIVQIENADGGSAFKSDLIKAILSAGDKPGMEALSSVAVLCHHNEDSSEPIMISKKAGKDKVFLVYADGQEELMSILDAFAQMYMKHTKPYKSTNPPPKAKVGRIINTNEVYIADRHLFKNDIASIIPELYPEAMNDGTFDDNEITADILSQYFSLISIDEAKELVMASYTTAR